MFISRPAQAEPQAVSRQQLQAAEPEEAPELYLLIRP